MFNVEEDTGTVCDSLVFDKRSNTEAAPAHSPGQAGGDAFSAHAAIAASIAHRYRLRPRAHKRVLPTASPRRVECVARRHFCGGRSGSLGAIFGDGSGGSAEEFEIGQILDAVSRFGSGVVVVVVVVVVYYDGIGREEGLVALMLIASPIGGVGTLQRRWRRRRLGGDRGCR